MRLIVRYPILGGMGKQFALRTLEAGAAPSQVWRHKRELSAIVGGTYRFTIKRGKLPTRYVRSMPDDLQKEYERVEGEIRDLRQELARLSEEGWNRGGAVSVADPE